MFVDIRARCSTICTVNVSLFPIFLHTVFMGLHFEDCQRGKSQFQANTSNIQCQLIEYNKKISLEITHF